METYRIVIPSRKRVENVARVLKLLPDATICVGESERAGYLTVVPKKQLVTHPDVTGLVHVRNWIADHFQEDCLVQIDDDLRQVYLLTDVKTRRTKDPEVIAQIIENSVRICEDLDIGVFCWNRTANRAMIEPTEEPIRLVQALSCALGTRGSARQRRWDPQIAGRGDFDFTLQTLLEDRILYCDNRFLFDHGRIFSGLGGNVGLVSDEDYRKSTMIIKERWGQYAGFDPPAWQKNRSVDGFSIRVKRRHPAALANL